MTDREKLLGLFHEYNAKYVTFCDDCFKDAPEELDSKMCGLVDHLLANGVTVRKTGRWIIHSNGRGNHATNWAECSECRVCGSPQWKVCPVCETKMEDT